jgi:hypothetical protein
MRNDKLNTAHISPPSSSKGWALAWGGSYSGSYNQPVFIINHPCPPQPTALPSLKGGEMKNVLNQQPVTSNQ